MFDMSKMFYYMGCTRFLTWGSLMGFREKMAWAMVVVLIVTGVTYFSTVFQASAALGAVAPPDLPLMFGYAVFLVVLTIVAAVIISVSRPSEAGEGPDERDKLIQYKGEAQSGRLMGALMIGALLGVGMSGDANLLFHFVFANLIIAQIAQFGFQILYYRRGA